MVYKSNIEEISKKQQYLLEGLKHCTNPVRLYMKYKDEENNGRLTSTVYGNDQVINYEYDEFDRIKKLIKNDNVYNYKYNSNGDLVKILSNNDIIKYTYDLAKRLYEYKYNDFKIKYTYNSNDVVINKKYSFNEIVQNINNILNKDDSVIKTIIDDDEINYIYDDLGRLISSNINNNYHTNYEYVTNGKRTSMLIKTTTINNEKYSYVYDSLNNIKQICHNDNLENEYYYDEYEQLIREDNYLENKTIRYTYDNLGNIIYKKEFQLNTYNQISQIKFEYNNKNFKDQLTKFNNDTITYDNFGNPLSMGEDITLTWINGRQLNSYRDNNKTINYKYDVDGYRTSKIINNVETKYLLEGRRVVFEQTGENILYFMRDNLNDLIGFKYNDEKYYYIRNDKDDIIGILDSQNNTIVKYKYDSWGNIISILDENNDDISNNPNHIGNINPYRYRSYYYDKETKLYYLNTRYYNPLWGRFLNIDGIISSGSTIEGNLYSYCSNDPINKIDEDGQKWLKKLWKKTTKYITTSAKNLKEVVTKTVKDLMSKVVSKIAVVFPAASQTLNHSLQNKPQDVYYAPYTVHAKKIKKSSEFQAKMKEFQTQKKLSKASVSFEKSLDLKLAYHNANIIVKEANDGKSARVIVWDDYNFEHWNYGGKQGFLTTLINNFGYYLFKAGIIEEYRLYIVFDYQY